MRIFKSIPGFVNRETGQDLAEYALIAALIATAIIIALLMVGYGEDIYHFIT